MLCICHVIYKKVNENDCSGNFKTDCSQVCIFSITALARQWMLQAYTPHPISALVTMHLCTSSALHHTLCICTCCICKLPVRYRYVCSCNFTLEQCICVYDATLHCVSQSAAHAAERQYLHLSLIIRAYARAYIRAAGRHCKGFTASVSLTYGQTCKVLCKKV